MVFRADITWGCGFDFVQTSQLSTAFFWLPASMLAALEPIVLFAELDFIAIGSIPSFLAGGYGVKVVRRQ